MRKGQTRSAQAWATVIVETITSTIQVKLGRDGDIGQILPLSLNLPSCSPGSATRMCQEVNLAKKQFDSREHGKREESIRKQSEISASGREAGPAYTPRVYAWVLKGNGQEFWATAPTGRRRGKSHMLDMAIAFAEENASNGAPEAKVDPFAEYYAMASSPVTTPAPQRVEDKQEGLLASLYGTQGEKP